MFPLSDINPSKNRPVVTRTIIAINVLAFIYTIIRVVKGTGLEFINEFAMTPFVVAQGTALHTPITSMFLHGGLAHIFGNMLYLYIFGDNIEDIMGRKRFIIFYLLCGLIASTSQLIFNPDSIVPNLGASGAVSGILGAYLVVFPKAKVNCILIFGFFIRFVTLPATFVLGFWFVIQFFSGLASIPSVAQDVAGIAYFAHIGGFVAGAAMVNLFKK